MYNSPSNNLRRNEWKNLLNFAENFENNLIICGDFNAHAPDWGSELGGCEGKWLKESMEENDLSILNNGKATKIYNGNKTSCPDITLVSPNIKLIGTWDTLDDTHDSDHFPIEISLNLETLTKKLIN